MDMSLLEGLVSPALRGDLSETVVSKAVMMVQEWSSVSICDVKPSALSVDTLEGLVDTSVWQFEGS